MTRSFRHDMPQQPLQKLSAVARPYPADTSVIEQRLSRAFPLPNDSSFDNLLIAIDLADLRASMQPVPARSE
jgi:hypothetical protein